MQKYPKLDLKRKNKEASAGKVLTKNNIQRGGPKSQKKKTFRNMRTLPL